MKREKKPEPTPRMTDEQLKEFVMGYCNGQIFTSAMVPQGDPSIMILVFMVLGFSKPGDLDQETLGLVWEWRSQAGPRGINGMPMFTSCRLMHKLDVKRAQVAIDAEVARRKDVKV